MQTTWAPVATAHVTSACVVCTTAQLERPIRHPGAESLQSVHSPWAASI